MHRVFLLCGYAVLTSAIESLLHQEPTVQLLGCEADPGRALEQIRALRPDVVIAISAEPVAAPLRTVLDLLAEGLDVRVIGLSLADNTACICSCEHRLLTCQEDLLSMIAPSTHTPGCARDLDSHAPSSSPQVRPPGN